MLQPEACASCLVLSGIAYAEPPHSAPCRILIKCSPLQTVENCVSTYGSDTLIHGVVVGKLYDQDRETSTYVNEQYCAPGVDGK